MAVVVCVHGFRHMGNCDYFDYEGQQFYVTARMYHIQSCPFTVSQPRLRLPGSASIGLDASDVPGVQSRCLKWAALRRYPFLFGLISIVMGCLQISNGALALCIFLITLGILLMLFGIWAFLQKPPASPEAQQMYIQKLRNFSRILTVLPIARAQPAPPPPPARQIPLITATVPASESCSDVELGSAKFQDDEGAERPLLKHSRSGSH